MPEIPIGGRGEGAISALLDLVVERRRRQEEEKQAQREFHRRLLQATVIQGVKQGTVDPLTLERIERPDPTQTIQQLLESQPRDTFRTDFGIDPKTGTITSLKFRTRSPREMARQRLLTLQETSTEAFLPQARRQVKRETPLTPFVAGPGGTAITGAEIETLPEVIIPREDIIAQRAQQLAEQLRQEAIARAEEIGQRLGALKPSGRPVVVADPTTGTLQPIGEVDPSSRVLVLPQVFQGGLLPTLTQDQGTSPTDLSQLSDEELADLAEAGNLEALFELQRRGILQ